MLPTSAPHRLSQCVMHVWAPVVSIVKLCQNISSTLLLQHMWHAAVISAQ